MLFTGLDDSGKAPVGCHQQSVETAGKSQINTVIDRMPELEGQLRGRFDESDHPFTEGGLGRLCVRHRTSLRSNHG